MVYVHSKNLRLMLGSMVLPGEQLDQGMMMGFLFHIRRK